MLPINQPNEADQYLGALAAVSIAQFVADMAAQRDLSLRQGGQYPFTYPTAEQPRQKQRHDEPDYAPHPVQPVQAPVFYNEDEELSEDEQDREEETFRRDDAEYGPPDDDDGEEREDEEYALNHGYDDYDDEDQGWGMTMM